uniref:Uncharacterized protein n=1 Tax=Arundo donax TaxID=35708 RepID=A0A0A9EGZ3_ARUDO
MHMLALHLYPTVYSQVLLKKFYFELIMVAKFEI